MDTYIVRIYRRDPKDSTKIHGVVEAVGHDEERPFKCLDELCKALSLICEMTSEVKRGGTP